MKIFKEEYTENIARNFSNTIINIGLMKPAVYTVDREDGTFDPSNIRMNFSTIAWQSQLEECMNVIK